MTSNTQFTHSNDLEEVREALADKIARWTEKDFRLTTKVPGLLLRKYDKLSGPTSYMHDPSICLVAQGAKRVFLSDEEYVYDSNHFLITSVGLPILAQVIEADKQKPYLGLVLKLDLREIAQLMVDSNFKRACPKQSKRGIAVGKLTAPLLNLFKRLLDLLDEPENIPVIAPLIQREILYRLLISEQGPRLQQLAMTGSHSQAITQAIDWLKGNYTKQLRINDLAARVGMSTSTFHHHFRSLTAMSPLQFQKWIRLHEARRLMLTERQDVTNAAFQVGYESPSQFTREYSRQFGAPPLRDIKRLQNI